MTFTFPFSPYKASFCWKRFWENFKDCRVGKEGSAGR